LKSKKKYDFFPFSIFFGGSQAASSKEKKIEGCKAARNSKTVFMQLSASEISPRNFHFAARGSFLGRISAGIRADTRQGQRVSASRCGSLIWLKLKADIRMRSDHL
jgi:hypothetical protein